MTEDFRRALFNLMTGKCACGRTLNRQGIACCRSCPTGKHSERCRRNNLGDAGPAEKR